MTGDGTPSAQLTIAGGGERYLLFSLHDRRYGLPLAGIQQVLPFATLSRPPGAPSLLAGFLNLRGRAVAVVALAEMFGIPQAAPGLESHLVLLHGDPAVALLVGRANEVVQVNQRDLLGVQSGMSLNECADGMLALESESIVLLNPQRLLLGQERKVLAELATQQQQRLDELEKSAP